LAWAIISFSDTMCSCCLAWTICTFFICFRANERLRSLPIRTSSTRPNPPTPNVATTCKSVSLTSPNPSLILEFHVNFNRLTTNFSFKSDYLRLVVISSTYLVRISSISLKSCLKASRSITRQQTPSASSAITLAVLVSSLIHLYC
jgi:hypothetical protein